MWMADEKQTPPEDDDWLAELGQESDSSGFDLSARSDIDDLLESSVKTGGSKQQNPAEGQIELDQATLSALLKGSRPAAIVNSAPVLLAGEATFNDASPDEFAVSQASLDVLLGSDSDDFQAALEDDGDVPSQSDIDQLFAQAQGPGSRPEDDFDLEELFDEQSGAPLPDDPVLTAAIAEWGRAPVAVQPQDPRTRKNAALQEEDIFAEETAAAPRPGRNKDWQKSLSRWPAITASRVLAAGLLVALLLLGGAFSFLARRGPAPPVPQMAAERQPTSLAQVPEVSPAEKLPPVLTPPTAPPLAKGAEYQMLLEGGEVPLLLFAQGRKGQDLSYEITIPPAHGRLTGKLPTPIYLPYNTFPGVDFLEFRVLDGMTASEPATIRISGPDLRRAAEKEKPEEPRLPAQKQPLLQAHNVTLKTSGSGELVIDWEKIWRQANQLPFTEEIHVEVVTEALHGQLQRIDQQQHVYLPDRLFSGADTVGYRFRMGAASSRVAELRLLVDPGDHPPQIRISGFEDRRYQVGETIVLDASTTRAADPETLRFEWQQLAGTPVLLRRINTEGSMVSFVVPSSFYGVEDPGPVLRLTVFDRSGQSDELIMKIATLSRRQSALWPGRP
jgi:hypothetical protein